MKRLSTRKLVISAVMMGVILVLSMTPLGFIPVGPIKATTNHIPVIIASIVEGPLVGGIVGLFFGLNSMFQAYSKPTVLSFIFLNPIVAVIPRILIGVLPYYVFKFLGKLEKKKLKVMSFGLWGAAAVYLCYMLVKSIRSNASYTQIIFTALMLSAVLFLLYRIVKMGGLELPIAMAALAGSLTNTVLVLGLVYVIYAEKFAEKMGIAIEAAGSTILAIALSSGTAEAVGAMIISAGVVSALIRGKR